MYDTEDRTFSLEFVVMSRLVQFQSVIYLFSSSHYIPDYVQLDLYLDLVITNNELSDPGIT